MRFIAATLLLATSALALPASAQVYVDAQLGGTRHGIFCSAGQNCDNSDFGYRLGVGYWFNEYVAVEYAYLNFGKSTASGFNAVPGQLTVEERKADAMGLYAVGRWPINAFGFHAKLGLVDGRVRRSSGIGSAGGVEFKTTSTYLMGGLGASYDFAPNWRAIAEWSRARVDLGAERPNFDLYAVGVQFRF